MSKKLAAGADAIVLDVKVGTGAFMKSVEQARLLAKTMVAIGTKAGRKTLAVITDMNEPLGNAVGNILEVKEAVECLRGQGEERLLKVSKILACYMLIAAEKAVDLEDAENKVENAIKSGAAFEKMKDFVNAQGGNSEYIEHIEKFESARYSLAVSGRELMEHSELYRDLEEAYLASCDNQEIGMVSLILGGGRETKDSVIDLTVGIQLGKHLGDCIQKDDCVAILYGNDKQRLTNAKERFLNAYTLSANKIDKNPVVYEVITEKDL